MGTILLIVLLLLLFGGGGGYYAHSLYGGAGLGGVLGLVLIIAVVLWLAVLTSAGWALPRVCSGGFSNKRPAYFASTWVQLGYTADSAYLSVTGLRIDLRPGPAPGVEGVASVSSAR